MVIIMIIPECIEEAVDAIMVGFKQRGGILQAEDDHDHDDKDVGDHDHDNKDVGDHDHAKDCDQWF